MRLNAALLCIVLSGLLFGCASRSPSPTPLEVDQRQLASLLRSHPAIADPQVTAFTQYLRDRLGTASQFQRKTGRATPQIIITSNPSPEAFAVGSRYVVVSSAMVKLLPTEAELAFVVAHEIAHQWLGHFERRQMKHFLAEQWEMEHEADATALGITALAGYDPRSSKAALLRVYQSIDPAASPTSHPGLAERIAALHRRLISSGWQPPGTIDRRDYRSLRAFLSEGRYSVLR